jgi:uncharacterized protein with FMN-binding domain
VRRVLLGLLATVAVIALALGYRTSTMGPGGVAAGHVRQQPAGGRTFAGSVAHIRWGDLQVVITVAGGRITDIAVPVHPSGNHRDLEINAAALPRLRAAALAAQSADIDSVSGATFTSGGYRESLQAALDAARLAIG